MKIGAVVCEYNPFHLGHQCQLQVARETLGLDAIVGIMSGNFVQRGDVAVYPKKLRARMALAGGMDLVLELPAVLTLQSAERYARNAVMTLHALGCVDALFFGAECPDTEVLLRIAEVLSAEDAPFQEALQKGLSAGLSFATARANAVRTLLGDASAEILSRPNNILAVEYCKALLRVKSKIKPIALPRQGPDHDAPLPCGNTASASAIREKMLLGQDFSNYLPCKAQALCQSTTPFSIKKMEAAILAQVALMQTEELQNILDVSEGLENAIAREVLQADSLTSLIEGVKSKRYAYSRIRRILLNAYLGITKDDANLTPQYIRILDFTPRGQEVLNLSRGTASLPLAKHGGQVKDSPDALRLWRRELAIERVYHLFSKNL